MIGTVGDMPEPGSRGPVPISPFEADRQYLRKHPKAQLLIWDKPRWLHDLRSLNNEAQRLMHHFPRTEFKVHRRTTENRRQVWITLGHKIV